MFPNVFFFLFSAFFCFSFFSLPLLFDILKPKSAHQMRSLACIYICIWQQYRKLVSRFMFFVKNGPRRAFKTVRVFSRETSVFTMFRELQFFCSCYVGFKLCRVSRGSWDNMGLCRAKWNFLSYSWHPMFPLWFFLGFSASSCPEVPVQVVLARALSDLDFLSHKVDFPRPCWYLARVHFPKLPWLPSLVEWESSMWVMKWMDCWWSANG